MSELYHSVAHSRMTLTEHMIPSYANLGGKIHGGILLSLMDKVAYACAAKHSAKYCVTVSVDEVAFREPVEVGEMVSLLASVNYVGRSSMVIGIKVVAENFQTGTVKHANTSFFTMVAKDEHGAPTEVPGLIVETRDDARRYLEAIKRRELATRYRSEFDDSKSSLEIDKELRALEGERYRLGPGL